MLRKSPIHFSEYLFLEMGRIAQLSVGYFTSEYKNYFEIIIITNCYFYFNNSTETEANYNNSTETEANYG